ncbi:MAG: glycosyltransferase family A protein [Agrobacterium cavarae]
MSNLKKSVFVAGVARNCAANLTRSLAVLDGLADVFDKLEYCFVTNDSTDDTAAMVSKWVSQRVNANCHQIDGLSANIKERTARIAACRNICLAELKKSMFRGNSFDYFLVFDMDGVNDNLIGPQELNEAIQSAPADWVALFANQRQVYYDIWALREERWCPTDCWEEVRNATNKHFFRRLTWKRAKQKFVISRQQHISPLTAPIKVESAFGGLGVYKVDAIGDALYIGLTENGAQVCEHVSFNKEIGKAGSLYILPSLLNDAPSEHTVSTLSTGR